MPENSYWSTLWRNLGFVASAIAGLSAVALICSGFQIGWASPFNELLEQYFVITSTIRSIAEPYVLPVFQFIADLMNIRLALADHWVDVFLMMMVYLGSRVKSYASSGKYIRVFFMLLISIVISIVASFIAAIDTPKTWVDAIWLSCVPLIGFLVYDLLYACVGATLDRRNRESWYDEFVRHLEFSAPLLFMAAGLNIVFAYTFVQLAGFSAHQGFILIFLSDYILISSYWAFRSFRYASDRKTRIQSGSPNEIMGESVYQRFKRSSATNVSLNVAIVIASASYFMLANAGVKRAGAGFTYICQ